MGSFWGYGKGNHTIKLGEVNEISKVSKVSKGSKGNKVGRGEGDHCKSGSPVVMSGSWGGVARVAWKL